MALDFRGEKMEEMEVHKNLMADNRKHGNSIHSTVKSKGRASVMHVLVWMPIGFVCITAKLLSVNETVARHSTSDNKSSK